jgi:hypothetical protein
MSPLCRSLQISDIPMACHTAAFRAENTTQGSVKKEEEQKKDN